MTSLIKNNSAAVVIIWALLLSGCSRTRQPQLRKAYVNLSALVTIHPEYAEIVRLKTALQQSAASVAYCKYHPHISPVFGTCDPYPEDSSIDKRLHQQFEDFSQQRQQQYLRSIVRDIESSRDLKLKAIEAVARQAIAQHAIEQKALYRRQDKALQLKYAAPRLAETLKRATLKNRVPSNDQDLDSKPLQTDLLEQQEKKDTAAQRAAALSDWLAKHTEEFASQKQAVSDQASADIKQLEASPTAPGEDEDYTQTALQGASVRILPNYSLMHIQTSNSNRQADLAGLQYQYRRVETLTAADVKRQAIRYGQRLGLNVVFVPEPGAQDKTQLFKQHFGSVWYHLGTKLR